MSDIPTRPPRIAAWLTAPMRRNRATYLRVALAAVMINVFGLVTSLFTMTVYDRVMPNNATASLIALSIGLGIVVVFDFILRTLRAYFVDIAGADIDRDIGDTLFRRLIALRLDAQRRSTGALTGVIRELETIRDFFASATITALVDVPFILLTLAVIAIIGGKIVFVPLVAVPLVIGAGWLTHPALDRLSARVMSGGLGKQAVLVETIGALEMVKASGAGPMLARRYARAVADHADGALRQRLVGSIAMTTAASANTLAYAGVVIVGVGMVAAREVTMGGLMACSILSSRAVAPLAQIASLLSRLTATRTAYTQVDGLMHAAVEGPEGDAIRPAVIDGRIEFRQVGFRYPGAQQDVIAGLSLVIPAGERVALLGRVGSGKSTLARLAMGLYRPDTGSVLIDGTDVGQFDPSLLRAHIGAATQESVLLTGSVRDNIRLDRAAIDDAEMLRVAGISATHDFMGRIANGYDLKLADRGEGLSGGQRQSIAIARALAGRPPVLIFDEPTSAMDAQTEAELIARLDRETAGRTLLLITHRPALLKLVERVIVMEDGRIVADGPRDQVLARIAGRPQAVA